MKELNNINTTFIAHQYKIRQEKEIIQKEEFQFLKDNVSLKNSFVKLINRADVEPIIKEYEWLKSMPSYVKYMFGIYFILEEKEYLGGIVIYSEEYTNNTDNWIKYGFHKKIILLSRGVCLWWTPKNTASYFISKTFDVLRKNTEFEVITATVDPLAGEVGTIYQSLNFHYAGLMEGNYNKSGGENKRLKIIINGKKYSSRSIRKKIGTIKKEEVLKHFPNAQFIYELRKRRYFYFLKNKKEHHKNFLPYIKPYPKKEDFYELMKNTNSIIYMIRNKINNKVYIGQTTKKLEDRIGNYKKDKAAYNQYLNNSFEKYGIENFEWIILEQCVSVYELNEREIFYIDLYDSRNREKGYNIEIGGRNKLISDETRQKQSEAHKGGKQSEEWVNKRKRFGEDHHCFGKKHSEEYKEDLSNKTKGENAYWYGKKRDLSNMKETKIEKYGKLVAQFNIKTGETIKVFRSISEAISDTGVTHQTITRHCMNKVKRFDSDISWKFL